MTTKPLAQKTKLQNFETIFEQCTWYRWIGGYESVWIEMCFHSTPFSFLFQNSISLFEKWWDIFYQLEFIIHISAFIPQISRIYRFILQLTRCPDRYRCMSASSWSLFAAFKSVSSCSSFVSEDNAIWKKWLKIHRLQLFVRIA